MVLDTEMVDVIFRLDREGIVFALMPGLAGTQDPRTCTAYEHVGQHSSADVRHCIDKSTPATQEEYASLLHELQGIGYLVNVVKRATRAHFEQRARQL